MGNEELKLSADLAYWKIDRPSEWIMARFIRKATELEASVSEAQDLYVQCKAKLNKAEEVLKQYADEGNWYKSNTSTSMPDLEDLWEGNSCDGFIIAQDYFKP